MTTLTSNCTAGCPTPGAHESWGECLRAKNAHIGYARSHLNVDYSREKRHQSRLNEYREARRQNIQPDSTSLADIRRAVQISNETGTAYRADK